MRGNNNSTSLKKDFLANIVEIEKSRIMRKAAKYLLEVPLTITEDRCERSKGGLNDFYSEGDYWWPNPDKPDAPYIRQDGMTNPDNFIAHRRSMIRLSDIIGTLTSAYMITADNKYFVHAVSHLKAWFVTKQTMMNPSLPYGQAVSGRCSGRSFGVIDTIHLVEVARGAKLLCSSPAFEVRLQNEIRAWFREYLRWLNKYRYGKKARKHPSNHGVCWSLQAAAFADLIGDEKQLAWIRKQFKKNYLMKMMDGNGGFPAELKRAKPYCYSLFVIDAMAGIAQIASTKEDDLWEFALPDGRSIKKGIEFIYPYIENKAAWRKKPDIAYWEEWPVRQPALLFAGLKFEKPEYLTLWESLESDPETFETLRNLPLRHPLLWIEQNST